jgi:hypothetical protein
VPYKHGNEIWKLINGLKIFNFLSGVTYQPVTIGVCALQNTIALICGISVICCNDVHFLLER